MENIKCFGLTFRGIKRSEIFTKLEKTKVVITVNSEFIVEAGNNPRFRVLINKSHSTFDGQIPFLVAKIRNTFRSFDKISGSDLIFDALNLSSGQGKRLFFLGGDEHTNQKAVTIANEKYGANCEGFSPSFSAYPFEESWNNGVKEALTQFSPDILFVGFGVLKQEYWIEDNYDFLNSLGVSVVIGSGGSFAFVAGTVDRAPKYIQQLGLEGIYRFFQEPGIYRLKRLIKSLGIFRFIAK
jgi:N-acetylglucosaminyldiphosphoundecaprenol N-acetyl-beta-D-mannosaminyltransferase